MLREKRTNFYIFILSADGGWATALGTRDTTANGPGPPPPGGAIPALSRMANKESQLHEVMSPVRREMDRQTSVFTPVLCYPLWGPFHLAGGSAEGHGPLREKPFTTQKLSPGAKKPGLP